MVCDAHQAALDDDRRFFAQHPERRHRTRRATPAEVSQARVSSPETVFDVRIRPGWYAWYATVRLLMSSPIVAAAMYTRGPPRLDQRIATDEQVADFYRHLERCAASNHRLDAWHAGATSA